MDSAAAGTSGAPVRVLLVDDHPVVRRGLAALLESLPGIEVVAQADSGTAAVREAQLSRPDVVVMDIQLPGVDGVEATRRIVAALPATAVLVLTMFDDDGTVLAAMRAGARGYLLKGAGQEEIRRAILAVAGGEAIFGPLVAARVLGHLTAPPRAAVAFPELTSREREVLDRIAAGQGNAGIAAALRLSVKTVGNHTSAIFTKLGVATRAEAIVRARDEGLGQKPPPDRAVLRPTR